MSKDPKLFLGEIPIKKIKNGESLIAKILTGDSLLFDFTVTLEKIILAFGNDPIGVITSTNRILKWTLYDAEGQPEDPQQIEMPITLEPNETLKWYSTYAFTSEGRVIDINQDTDITSTYLLDTDEKIVDFKDNRTTFSTTRITMALTSNHRIFTWGRNNEGAIGDGTNDNPTDPVDITSNFNFDLDEYPMSIYVGSGWRGRSSMALLTSKQRIYTWGQNSNNQLGNGNTTDTNLPVVVFSSNDLDTNEEIKIFDYNGKLGWVITTNDRIFIWGQATYGESGTGGATYPWEYPTPTDITSYLSLESGEEIERFYHEDEVSLLITSYGKIYAAGSDDAGQASKNSLGITQEWTEIQHHFNLEEEDYIENIFRLDKGTLFISKEGRIFEWGWEYEGIGSKERVEITDLGDLINIGN